MIGFGKHAGKRGTAGLALLGAALAVPFAASLAMAQDAAPAASPPLTAEQVTKAREIFNNFSCGACHSLVEAGASGQIGPAFDGATTLDHDYIVNRVTNGQGAMPSFGGQISDEDIDLLATYIMQVKK